MTRYGVQIEKSTSFRGAAQPFSNTYYYEAPVPAQGSEGYLNDLIDDILAVERPLHATSVNFIFARAWSQIGTKEQNEMKVQRALTGTGSNSSLAHATMDKERAFLVRFRAGNDSRGRPVYLRKWWHLLAEAYGGATVPNSVLQNTAELSTNVRSFLEAEANKLKVVTPGAGPNAELVAKSGRTISGSTLAHRFLEHHQLGDAWRGV